MPVTYDPAPLIMSQYDKELYAAVPKFERACLICLDCSSDVSLKSFNPKP